VNRLPARSARKQFRDSFRSHFDHALRISLPMLNQQLVAIVSRTLNVDPSTVTPETSPENTAAWDSIGHLNLILELEEEFQVRFPTEQIPQLNSVARLQEAIAQQSG